MSKHYIYYLCLFSLQSIATENSITIDVFDTSLKLPLSCSLQVEDTNQRDELVIYKCDKDMDYETGIIIENYDHKKIIETQGTDEVTKSFESKIGNITHFHIEATIPTARGDSENFIDAFCDVNYCIVALGTSDIIAKSIESQLNNRPNKNRQQEAADAAPLL
jgi:hypothetical protein